MKVEKIVANVNPMANNNDDDVDVDDNNSNGNYNNKDREKYNKVWKKTIYVLDMQLLHVKLEICALIVLSSHFRAQMETTVNSVGQSIRSKIVAGYNGC